MPQRYGVILSKEGKNMIYVTADIHGNMERYRSLMSKIDLKPNDTLYVLGDVIDRHPDGIKILLEIMDSENIKMLLGNHEYMMLNALRPSPKANIFEKVENVRLWHNNGGMVTHDAFINETLDTKDRIISFLENLPINIDLEVNGKKFKLVHADSLTRYPSFCKAHRRFNPYYDRTEFAVWNRWEIGDSKPRNYSMIFGHTPTNNYQYQIPFCIYRNGNIIGVDCGAGLPLGRKRGPRLGCLRLDDMAEFYSDLM